METQLFVVDLFEFDTDPAAHTNIRRRKEFSGVGLDQRRLKSRRCGNPNCNVAVMVMVVGEHYVDFFRDKESGLAVGKVFSGAWQSGAETTHPSQMFLASNRRTLFRRG